MRSAGWKTGRSLDMWFLRYASDRHTDMLLYVPWVCVSVCLLGTRMNPAETVGPIEVL